MEPMYLYATPRQVTQWLQDRASKATPQKAGHVQEAGTTAAIPKSSTNTGKVK
ncbi:hypothetical protein CLV24_13814 [Pontibacter ummariensis]|uniref:Uncharacterized protein n=1 Tax=Pontibacter ummariensis TaxID=1610492 RepID=A0A239L9V0_9BACT|nr:hypothetical protein CLV24_13814 [Pontibacter ummariensis]SNT27396.1 hypothetical protein SAMN06296052_13819 [Pontibacter ummariensis]